MSDCNGDITDIDCVFYSLMVSPRDHVMPIPHYRPTAQLMKDRDRQEQTYLLSPVLRLSRTFITNVYKRCFIFL